MTDKSGEPAKLFDLGDSEGVNESERILTKLCRRSFLRLWSQTNIYTDEGYKEGKGGTKELCDALVIFGNDVIIFSDKHITFQAGRPLNVAWPRWYKRAVLDSCKQLHGAESWLRRFPTRAFLDAKCQRALPIAVPTNAAVRFHLVAVTRGGQEAAIAAQGKGSLGSFFVDTELHGDEHFKAPFTLGFPRPGKRFVHVFDEVTIELLMAEFDTAVDFLDYLKAREELLGRPDCAVMAPGEEQLMAVYLITMDKSGLRHVFLNVPDGAELPDTIVFDDTFYKRLKSEPGYRRKKIADGISYEWDRLIERFLEYGDPGIHPVFVDQGKADTETGLRLLAAESRFRRRQLATTFTGALMRVEAGERVGRLVYSGVAGETVFIFVVVPKRQAETYDDYRGYRMSVLHAYVRTARLKAPLGTTFVGIAFDNPNKDYQGGSEDLFVWSKESWTDAELAELEEKRIGLGLWGKTMEYSRYRQDEFPQADQAIAIRPVPAPGWAEGTPQDRDKGKAVKRRKKMQQKSKRQNRRK